MLLFDPEPPYLHWWLSDGGQPAEGRCLAVANWAQSVVRAVADPTAVRWIGYVLQNGGEVITDPVSRLTPENLDRVKLTIERLPEHNELTCRVAQEWMTRLPEVPHLLFCETAFFARLPPEAGLYALPYVLSKKGIRRYGGYGLCHQWAWQQAVRLLDKRPARVVSVYVGDHTNMAAIRNGLPVDTTIGFAPADGIISATTCGDIDPTVIFQMQAAGMSLAQIRSLLSSKSGFTGLLGRRVGLLEILNDSSDPQAHLARQMLRYGILRHIGACIAVLGGLDALVFTTPCPNACQGFLADICQGLACAGVRPRTDPAGQETDCELTDAASLVKVLSLGYKKWQVLAEHGAAFLRKQGHRT
jgi:acetate kinase